MKKNLSVHTLLLAAALCGSTEPATPFEMPGATASRSVSGELVNKNADGLAVGGYDVVSYFDQKQAMKGIDAYTAAYGGATYRFISQEHRNLFAKDPEKFLPQYGGFCAYGASQGHKALVDPEAWTVIDGKLYLNYNKQVQKAFLKNSSRDLQEADANWEKLKK